MSNLDPCIPITPVTGAACIPATGTANCDSTQVPIGICAPLINPSPEDPKCVNDNARRPWPTPPPVEIGCNPVSLRITNEPTEEDDVDQTIRLEGSVTYISGDACLPQVNLNLVVPPNIASGGGAPSLSGFGYTQYANCVRVGPVQNSDYDTPQDFFSNEPGAAAFIAKSTGEMNQLGECEAGCVARERFGSQVAKFNLIGPILAEITGSYPIAYASVAGQSIAVGWKYGWAYATCVTAANTCVPACFPSIWTRYDGSLSYSEAVNNKEVVYGGYMTPGVSLAKQVQRGFRPQPIMGGTQVFIYGWVPWGPEESSACNCSITWFFSEQVAFDGDCEEATGSGIVGAASMLPQRNITSAGMFFGSPENANRV